MHAEDEILTPKGTEYFFGINIYGTKKTNITFAVSHSSELASFFLSRKDINLKNRKQVQYNLRFFSHLTISSGRIRLPTNILDNLAEGN